MNRVAVILLLAVVAAFPGGVANATTSIVSVVPAGIFFAADSNTIAETESRSRHQFSCKIIQPSSVNPGVWMTAAGVDYLGITGSAELDVSRIAMSNISLHYDLYDGVVAFADDLSLRLTYALIATRRRFPASFSKLLPRDGSTVTETAFGQVLPDGRVDLYVVRFVGRMRANPTHVSIEPVIVGKSGMTDGVVFLGFADEITATSQVRGLDLGSPEDLRKAIEVEVRAHPDKVAPPVAILKLDRNGPHWIARGLC
jgi:hypothetical protein